MTERTTTVVFRVWRAHPRTCFALFPFIDEDNGLCSSFEHVGQHSAADYNGCIDRSRAATPEEYAPLKRELEGAPYGYKLRAAKRRPARKPNDEEEA